MALEEFLMDLCEESVTAALLVRFDDDIQPTTLWDGMREPPRHGNGDRLGYGEKKTDNCVRRPSGSFKHIFTISPRIRNPTRFRHVAVSTTRFSTLCLDLLIPLVMRRSRKTSYQSRFFLVLSLPVLRCPCSPSGLALSQSPKLASLNPSPMKRRNRRRTPSPRGLAQLPSETRDRGVPEIMDGPLVHQILKGQETLHPSLRAVLDRLR